MTGNIIRITATDGTTVEFIDEIKGQGGMKDVYFSPDRSYVVAFFRDKQDATAKERLNMIAGIYRERIFQQIGGDYWLNLYCWVTKVVEYKGRLGVVTPFFNPVFFFKHGSKNNDFLKIQGKEKEGKWFASASNQNRFLDPRERGNWLSYFRVCILISRAVRRMHAAGLAHSDLSYKNVLVDPAGGNACLIDIDGLVVPGKFPPDVVGTPDFIAPEVLQTSHLPVGDANKNLPRIETDRHALAVLIYMYLFYRHPLRGKKIHDPDPQKDELLAMGERALFIEHPTDLSNRPNLNDVKPTSLPWADVTKIPYTIGGPYLTKLFDRAFIEGLHDPSKRPTAEEWEQGLIKTVDLMQPCQNQSCEQKWYVFDNTLKPSCPFCKTAYQGQLPVLNLYSSYGNGKFLPDNHRLMVYHNQYLYPWHVNRRIAPNEKLEESQKKPVGYFVLQQGKWFFVNQTLPKMKDLTEDKEIAVKSMVEITDGKKILLSDEEGGRLLLVQMVNG
jgi:serine/threonine protein kinase